MALRKPWPAAGPGQSQSPHMGLELAEGLKRLKPSQAKPKPGLPGQARLVLTHVTGRLERFKILVGTLWGSNVTTVILRWCTFVLYSCYYPSVQCQNFTSEARAIADWSAALGCARASLHRPSLLSSFLGTWCVLHSSTSVHIHCSLSIVPFLLFSVV